MGRYIGALQITVSSLALVAGLAAVAWFATYSSSDRQTPIALSAELANAQASLERPRPQLESDSTAVAPSKAVNDSVAPPDEALGGTGSETAAREDDGSETLVSASLAETSASTNL